MSKQRGGVFEKPLLSTKIKSANVKMPEMLFGYFLGPFGALLASGVFANFLNRYWTDVLFADQKLADGSLPANITTFLTLLPLLSAILIVAGNVAVGQLIERTRTKAGKARPWILLSSVLLAVSCIFMFVAPGNDPVAKMALTAISYNVYYSVAYPMYNTSNSTLVPVSTRNGNQRGLLASFTNFANLGVMGAGGMVFPMVVGWFLGGWDKPNRTAWMVAFIAIGLVTFLFTVLQYYFTRERVTEETLNSPAADESKVSVKKQLKAVATQPFWWIIIIFYLLFQFSGAFKNLSITYFCSQQFASTAIGGDLANTVINVCGAIPMAIAMAFIWPLSVKFGKRIVVLIGLVVGVAGGVLAGAFAGNFYVVAVGVALKSFGSAPACYMILAMISDVLDHIEAKNGYRCDGFTMSIYSSIMAAATPVATGLFNAISGGGVNAAAVTVSYIWIETAAYAACAVLLIFFSVEKYLKQDRQTVLDRQKAEAEAAGIEWIPPEERLRLEQEQADREADAARRSELKVRCDKKGLSFDEEEAKYQAKQAAKLAKQKK
ncbi:MAG: MFS transporter [Clostridia bacterium]|nr:MFS transporter [Clostridia bacterium]